MVWSYLGKYCSQSPNARKRSSADNKRGRDAPPQLAPPPPFKDLGPVIKAPLDSKRYKVVELPNGLRATLVSTCLHETNMPGRDADNINNAEEDMIVHHSTLSKISTTSPEPKPSLSESLQKNIDNFNRIHLGIQNYNQFGESKNVKNENSETLPDGDKNSLSNCVDTHSSPNPAKVPKLLKCCDDGPSTICVTVNAGSFHDPRDVPGLAHFVEHLIFLGSKQHPETNKLFNKVFENKGLVNATTYPEHTNFYFSCNFSAFEECVDILVDGLTNPLFRAADVRREIEAVDSEYGIKQTCDYTRVADFLRSRAKNGHPFQNFYWGNKATLNRTDIRDRATNFRKQFYKANYMTVCIQAPIPMEQLEELVVKHFSDIPSAPADAKSPSELLLAHGHPFDGDAFETSYLVSPVSRFTCLAITWTLPVEIWKNYETKPLEYIRIMLQDTSPGGLKHYLREKQWITEWNNVDVNCCAVDNYCRSAYCSLFTLSIYLTDKGYEAGGDVALAVFSYLKFLSIGGVESRIFEEMKRTAATKFHFHNWTEMLESGVNLAVNMQNVPPAHILTSSTLLTKWDPEAIKQCLQLLTPRKANYILVACQNSQTCRKKAWPCHIKYHKENITPEDYTSLENVRLYPEFRMPPNGTFLVKEIRLDVVGGNRHPGTIFKSEKLVVEHLNLQMSPCLAPQVPSALYTIFLSSHLIAGRPCMAQQGVMDFWIRLLQDKIVPQVGHKFDHLFGLSFQMSDDGISVDVAGPRCHLVELLTLVVRAIFGVGEDVTSTQNPKNVDFAENLKRDIVREYWNDTNDVDLLTRDLTEYLLKKNHATLFEIRNEIENISVRDKEFAQLINQFRRRMLISIELQGSVTSEDAQQIVNLFTGKSQEKIEYLPPGILPDITDRATLLPLGTSQLNIKALHPAYVTSVVTNFYQVDMWDGEKAQYFIRLLYHLMRRPIANQLRTKEQLGYTVRLSPRFEGGYEALGLAVTVLTHPHKFSTANVDLRIDEFFRTFCIKALKSEELKSYIKRILGADTAKTLTALETFIKDNFIKGGVNFRKLSIRLEGYKPGTRIPAKKQEQLANAGEDTEKDDGSWSMIQLEYMTAKDKETKEKFANNGVRIIEDVGQFKKELGLLSNS